MGEIRVEAKGSLSDGQAKEWDAFLSSCPDGNFFQASFWAQYASALKAKPMFLSAHENGAQVGALLLLEGFVLSFQHSRLGPIRTGHVKRMISQSLFPVISWGGGPVVSQGSPKAARALLEHAFRLPRARGALLREISLPIGAQLPGAREAFIENGFHPKKKATFLLDLKKGEDGLSSSFSKKCRKALRLADENGITVDRVSESDRQEEELMDYFSFIEARESELGFRNASLPALKDAWRIMRPHGAIEVFIAKKGDEALAGMGVWQFNGKIIEFASGITKDAGAQFAGDAIKWAIMRWGVANGWRQYDLAGVAPKPRSEKEESIFRFKEKWGGEYVEYEEFSKNNSSALKAVLGARDRLQSMRGHKR